MNTEREILRNCFESDSPLWNDFLNESGKLNILYYPSTGEDLSPVIYSSNKFHSSQFEYSPRHYQDSRFEETDYFEPDFYIFSDYLAFPYHNAIDKIKEMALNRGISIDEICELFPSDKYNYEFFLHFLKVESNPENNK